MSIKFLSQRRASPRVANPRRRRQRRLAEIREAVREFSSIELTDEQAERLLDARTRARAVAEMARIAVAACAGRG